jgi:hypothetical protein
MSEERKLEMSLRNVQISRIFFLNRTGSSALSSAFILSDIKTALKVLEAMQYRQLLQEHSDLFST